MNSIRAKSLRTCALVLVLMLTLATGCHRRLAVDEYPPNALKVRYVSATDFTDCLLASAVMCMNYVVGQDRFAAPRVRQQMDSEGFDLTRVGDVRMFLEGRRIKLIPLKGELSTEPPLGLAWWVISRGYPVICVVNEEEGAPEEFNHAVVVIGVDVDDNGDNGSDNGSGIGDVIVLDPASQKRLERWDRETFLSRWQPTGNVMLLVFDVANHAVVDRGLPWKQNTEDGLGS
ncbi:MAG: hypothetical protein DHS20C16_13480 [Phycisphaerae bacterium]|nr:MAG: hypothetical protein DHS20C16_13480 [Phycisphaerae bacterium]